MRKLSKLASYKLVPSPSAKINFFSILAKNYSRIEIELFLLGAISQGKPEFVSNVF